MKARAPLAFLLTIFTLVLTAQDNDTIPKGIHQAESEYYSQHIDLVPADNDSDTGSPVKLKAGLRNQLTHMVYGWHPYWASSTAYQSYDYTCLTHIAYFSYEVDTATGGYSSLRGWSTTPVISYAHQNGVKVTLTVTNFGAARNTVILSDTLKQLFMINTLIQLLTDRNGDGVNFDFETVPSAQKANMVAFCKRAVRMIKAELPDAEISLATPAVDWAGAWDYKALADICDYLIIMGYNYYWSGSSTAGPVAPLAGEPQNVTKSVDTYLNAGVPPAKLLLGVPWYGYDWPVVSNTRKAATTGAGTARVFYLAEQLAETYGKDFDETTRVTWVSYSSSSVYRQLWYDDCYSLSLKNDLVKNRSLAGIGIWALSYDDGREAIWESLKDSFSPNTPEKCSIVKITPNPASASALITFTVPHRDYVTIRIVDMEGRLRTVVLSRMMDPGKYDEPVNVNPLKQGVYICIINTSSCSSSLKLLVLK